MRASALVQFASTMTFVSIAGIGAIASPSSQSSTAARAIARFWAMLIEALSAKGRPVRLVTGIGAIASAAAGFGQATPHGGQFQVNTYTTGNQGVPAVAADPQGRMWVVWMSAAESGDPGWGLRAQRYAADGVPQGSPFQINGATTLNQAPRALRVEAVALHGHAGKVREKVAGNPSLAQIATTLRYMQATARMLVARIDYALPSSMVPPSDL